jgi:hypothetical protein
MSRKIEIAPEELDRLVDEGKENVLQYFDLDNLRRGDSKRINIDMPMPFLAALDREAGRRGITRQSLIKAWLYDRLMTALASSPSSEIEVQSVSQFKQAADNMSLIKSSGAILESLLEKPQSAGATRSVKRKVSAKK